MSIRDNNTNNNGDDDDDDDDDDNDDNNNNNNNNVRAPTQLTPATDREATDLTTKLLLNTV